MIKRIVFIITFITALYNFNTLYAHSDSFLNNTEVAGTSDLAFKNFWNHPICNPKIGTTIPNDGTVPQLFLKRFKVVYLYTTNDNLETNRKQIAELLVNSDNILDLNAKVYGKNLHYNFEVDTLCNPVIYSMKESIGNLDKDLEAKFGKEIKDASKFIIFVESVNSECGLYSGIEQGDNENLSGFAIIYKNCWNIRVMMHEVNHSLGSVQFDAPNSDFTYHVKNSLNDIMSYNVGHSCPKTEENEFLFRMSLLEDCWQINYMDFNNSGKVKYNLYNSKWLNHNIVYKLYFGVRN